METLVVDSSLHMYCKPFEEQNWSGSPKTSRSLVVPGSSFDMGLNLRNSEHEAKQKVSLPFEAVQKQEGMFQLFL